MKYQITFTLNFKTGEVSHPNPVIVNGKKAADEMARQIIAGQALRGREVTDIEIKPV